MSHYNVDESELYDSNNNIKTDPIFIHKIELDNLVVKKHIIQEMNIFLICLMLEIEWFFC